MNRITILTAIAVVLSMSSCIKEDYSKCNKNNTEVTVSFTEDENETRAFFGTTAAAEAWEKSLSSLTAWVFTEAGELIAERKFTAAELSAKKANFAIPNSHANKDCHFYVVANMAVGPISSKADLDGAIESNNAAYNGTFAEVSTKSKRTEGFVMSGSVKQKVSAQNATTNVSITLKRTVAKVAVQLVTDAAFASKYPGTIVVQSISIGKAATQGYIMQSSTDRNTTMSFNHSQASNNSSGNYQNLFYIYENGQKSDADCVKLTVKAIYYPNGTGSVGTEVEYIINISGSGSNKIMRNGYYRIDAKITGLTGVETNSTITVAEWETPVTQSVSVGS